MCIQKYGSARRARRIFFVWSGLQGDRFFLQPEVLLESLIVMLG
jgi:hypothetical protein